MNQITMLGRLTADPKYITTQTGKTIASFSLAVSKKYKDQEQTTFINCKAFDKKADVINQHFRKGHRILISGELVQEKYTNRDGQEVNTYSIIIQNLDLIEKREDAAQQAGAIKQQVQNNGGGITPDDEDLPF